jgi:Tol biopolymer transport system component
LEWVTRDGKITPLPLQPQPFNTPRISPDGSKLAVDLGDPNGNNDIAIYDFKKETFNRLTFSNEVNTPLWSRDGKRIYYSVSVPAGVAVQPADGSSQGARIMKSPMPQYPVSLTPNGTQMVLSGFGGSGIMIADLGKGTEPTALIASHPYSYGGVISPNGKYIAYGSNETGSLEIFVRSFPDLKGKWQVSVGGGGNPLWSPDGKELFYVTTVNKMMAVSISTSQVFSAGSPRELFDISQMWLPNNPVTNFDITPDGKRFIMLQSVKGSARTTSFNYVQNWVKELEKLGR